MWVLGRFHTSHGGLLHFIPPCRPVTQPPWSVHLVVECGRVVGAEGVDCRGQHGLTLVLRRLRVHLVVLGDHHVGALAVLEVAARVVAADDEVGVVVDLHPAGAELVEVRAVGVGVVVAVVVVGGVGDGAGGLAGRRTDGAGGLGGGGRDRAGGVGHGVVRAVVTAARAQGQGQGGESGCGGHRAASGAVV